MSGQDRQRQRSLEKAQTSLESMGERLRLASEHLANVETPIIRAGVYDEFVDDLMRVRRGIFDALTALGAVERRLKGDPPL